MENFNSIIEKALDIACQEEGISDHTKQKIKNQSSLSLKEWRL